MTETYGYDKTPTPPRDYDVSKVPTEIKKRSTWVKTKFTGEDVAEAYRQAMEIAGIYADEAKQIAHQTEQRQDLLEDFNDRVIQEMTDKDVISAPEIIQMRDGEATASDRLARDLGDMTTYRPEQLSLIDKFIEEIGERSVNVKWFGAKGDGITDDTAAIQNGIDQVSNKGGGIVYVPNGVYMVEASGSGDDWQGKGLLLRDNVHLLLSEGATIQAIPTDQTNYKIINIRDVENVTIEGGTIKGDRHEHLGTAGEWGRNISINGSKNITLKNVLSKDSWGDGLVIAGSTTMDYSENVTLDNFVADNNRRQGISVISVKGLTGYDVELSNTNGTTPQAGIDFEPDSTNQFLEDIHFDGLKTINNKGTGILIYLKNLKDQYKMNMTFDRVISDSDDGGGIGFFRFTGISEGVITFNQPIIRNSGGAGVNIGGISKKFSKIRLIEPQILDFNRLKRPTVSGSGITVTRRSNDSDLENFKMGNLLIENPVFREHTSNTVSDMIFQNQSSLGNNYMFEDVELIGFKTNRLWGIGRLSKSYIDTKYIDPLPRNRFTKNSDGVYEYTYTSGSSTFYSELYLPSDGNVIINLNNNKELYDLPHKLRLVHFGGSNHVTIRVVDDRLRPLIFSKGVNKGLTLPQNWLNEGVYIDLEYFDYRWRVVQFTGDWVPEE